MPNDFGNRLAETFYNIAVDANDISAIVSIRDSALAAFANGEASSITSINLNGKTTQFLVPEGSSNLAVIIAAGDAIKWWNDGGRITIEVPDYRYMNT
jgi:hypothetical protein